MLKEALEASARFLVLEPSGSHSHCLLLVKQVIKATTNLRCGTLASTVLVRK